MCVSNHLLNCVLLFVYEEDVALGLVHLPCVLVASVCVCAALHPCFATHS